MLMKLTTKAYQEEKKKKIVVSKTELAYFSIGMGILALQLLL